MEAHVQFENWDVTALSNNGTVISIHSRFEGILARHVLFFKDELY